MMETTTEVIDWACDACGNAISDGGGFVYVNTTAAQRGESDVPWRVGHAACMDPAACYEYDFAIERIRTVDQAKDWTHHLLGKRWVANTNWPEFIADRLP